MALDIFVFIVGLIVGSFLNVCIYRLPKGESIVTPPSHCPACKQNILWYDNIPVLSYIFLGGKCRSCKTKINLRYPAVELLTAAIFLLLFVTFGVKAKFFAYSILASGLIVATFVDFEIQEIPGEVTNIGTALGIAFSLILPSLFNEIARWRGLVASFLGILTGALVIYLAKSIGTVCCRKKLEALGEESAMGSGDIFLLAMIGAFLGWKLTLLTVIMASIFGSVVGVVQKFKYGIEIIPFGPYLSLGALSSIFFGHDIWVFYSSLYHFH